MEYAVYRWLAADVGKHIVVSAERQELIECHLVAVGVAVPRVYVAECTEKLPHEIDHYLRIDEVHKFTDLRVLDGPRIILLHLQGQDELLDSEKDCRLGCRSQIFIDTWTKFNQERNEAGEVKLVFGLVPDVL